MSQTLTLTASGLWTSPNDASKVPAGSMRIAKAVDLSRTGLIRPRRGYSLLTDMPSDPRRLFFYNDALLAHLVDDSLRYFDGSTIHNMGSLVPPSPANSIKMLQFQRNAYFTSDSGIKKLDSLTGSLYPAGVPKGLMMSGALGGSGVAALDGQYVAYRYVVCRYDANKNLVVGGVSDKLTIHNASGSDKEVDVRIFLPAGLDDTFFVQVYRSPNSTVSAINEELQQCYETPITSANVTDGYLDFTDVVPDDLLGTTIYTASSQEGLVNDNGSGPPVAVDIAEYKNCMFYANVTYRQTFAVTIVSVGGSGIISGDTITISNGVITEVYTGAVSESVPSKEFKVSASSSLALRIDETTQSLVNVINRSSAFVYAYTVTDGTGLPGKIRIEARNLGSSAFTVRSSREVAFSPQLPSTPTATTTSSANASKNRIVYSKQGIGEAVPAANFFSVGSADDNILRIIGLRDGLFILSEGGVYILTGEDASSFSVYPLDLTCITVAPDSVITINNLIYGLFEAGIAELSTSGAKYFSEPIQDKIQELYGLALNQTKKAFAFGSQIDSKYYLCLPSSSAEEPSDYQLIYHLIQKAFVEDEQSILCGASSPEGFIHVGLKDSKNILKERKTFTDDDFADEIAMVTITSASGVEIEVSGDLLDWNVGDAIYQDLIGTATVVAIDYDAGILTLSADIAWDVGQLASHYKPIDSDWEYNREFAGNPAGLKHFNTCIILFKQLPRVSMAVQFNSDMATLTEEIEIEGVGATDEWGGAPWGSGPWGSQTLASPRRVGVPRTVARCSALTVRLSHATVFAGFEIVGVSLVFIATGNRVYR